MITSVNAGATQSTGKTRRPVYAILKRGLVSFVLSIAAAHALAQAPPANKNFLDRPRPVYITGQTGQVHMEMTCDLDICELERNINGSYVLQKTTTMYRDTFAPSLPAGTHRFLFRRCSWYYQGYVSTGGSCFSEYQLVVVLRMG